MKAIARIVTMGLWLGATVFGGVSVAYHMIRERAGKLGDISVEEVDGLYALAVFLPGPSFLNLWGFVSARAGGALGALVGQVALLLPAFTLVMLLPLMERIGYFAAHGDGALNGAVWGTAGLLIATGIDQVRKVRTWPHRALLLGVVVALLFGANTVWLMLVVMIGAGALAYGQQVRLGGMSR